MNSKFTYTQLKTIHVPRILFSSFSLQFTHYYMYINSKSGCNRCPKCEILKARKQKKRNRGREMAKITDKRYLHKI